MFLNDMNVPNIEETITELRSKAKFVLLPTSMLSVPWLWAVPYGLHHLSKHLLTPIIKEGIDVQGGNYGNALQAASAGGHKGIVQLLLDKDADVNTQGDQYGNALQAA